MTSTPATPWVRPTRAELLEQLAEARAAGARARVSELLGKLMLTPHDRPDEDTTSAITTRIDARTTGDTSGMSRGSH